MGTTSTGISSAASSTINSGAEPTMSNKDNNNVGGHPKGTTVAYSIDLQKKIVLIKNEAAEAFSDVRCHVKCLNKTVLWGMLSVIMQRTKEKYNIPAKVIILIETIRSWVK